MSDSVHILFIALSLILITILIFRECNMKKKYIEKFGHDKPQSHVVLIGDDILNNIDYVYDDETIEYNLTLEDLEVHNYAKSNAKINDMYKQFINIHRKGDKVKKEMKKNVYIVISTGRDELLNNNQIKNSIYTKKEKVDIQKLWNEYKESVERIEKELKIKGYKPNIILIGLYLPRDKDYRGYEKIIQKWNTRLSEYSYKNSYGYINTYKLLNKENHFINKLYISEEGSIVIAESISKLVPKK